MFRNLKNSSTRDEYRRIRVLLPLMVFPGFVIMLPGSTVENIMKHYGFRESLGGLANVVCFLGVTLAILSLTHLMKMLSTRELLVGTCLTLSISLLACSASPWYPVFLIFFLIAGAATGVLIAFPGIYVINVFGEKSAHGQNILYGFASLGQVLSPIVSGLIINNGLSWRWAYVVPAALILPLVLIMSGSDLINLTHVQTLSLKMVRLISRDNRALFWGLLLGVTLYMGAASSVALWVIRYFDESFAKIIIEPHLVLAAVWVGITLGRLLCGVLSHWVKPYYILLAIVTAATIFLFATPLLGSQKAALALYPLIGLMLSGIFPMLVSYTAKFSPEHSGIVFTLYVAIGAVGGMVLPYIIGLFSQFGNIPLAMAMIGVPMLALLCIILRLRNLLGDHAVIVGEPERLPPNHFGNH